MAMENQPMSRVVRGDTDGDFVSHDDPNLEAFHFS